MNGKVNKDILLNIGIKLYLSVKKNKYYLQLHGEIMIEEMI